MAAPSGRFPSRGPKKLEVKEPPPVEGRVPPHDLDVEAAVLSQIMNDSSALEKIVGFLHPEHFYSESHRRIFEAMLELAGQGKPTELVMVMSWLRDRNRLQQVGAEYLAQVHTQPAAIANVAAYAKVIHEKWRVRMMISMCQRQAATGYIDYGDAGRFIAEMSAAIETIATINSGLEFRSGAEIMREPPKDDDIRFLIEQLKLGPGRPCMVGGDSYTGKSLIVGDIAVCVATKRDVFGLFRVGESGFVRWLNFDQSPKLAERRIRRIARARGVSPEELRGRFEMCHFPEFRLDDDDAEAVLCRVTKGVSLCVIDALIGAIGRTQERDEAMGRMLLKLMRVSFKTGCTFLVIHHTTKPQAEFVDKSGTIQQRTHGPTRSASATIRGNRAIFGACDSVFVLESTGKKKPVRIIHDKAPTDGQTLENFYVDFRDVAEDKPNGLLDEDDKPTDRTWGLRVIHLEPEQVEVKQERKSDEQALREKSDAKEKHFADLCDVYLELVKKHPLCDTDQLFEEGPVGRKATVVAVMKRLEDLKKVVDQGGKKKNQRAWRAV